MLEQVDPYRSVAPWQRQFLNMEFREHEVQRVKQAARVLKPLQSVSGPAELDEVLLYTVPVRLSAHWRNQLSQHGTPIGLGVLYNQDGNPIPAAVAPGRPVPEDHQLIRITSARRVILMSAPKSTIGDFGLLVESWEYANSLLVYVDLPYEPAEMVDILQEATRSDRDTASHLVQPLLSSPQVARRGGITAGADGSGHSAKALREYAGATRSLAPPEMRDWPDSPAGRGAWLPYRSGLQFHWADRPPLVDHRLDAAPLTGAGQFLEYVVQPGPRTEDSRFGYLNLPSGAVKTRGWGVLLSHTSVDAPLGEPLVDSLDIRTATPGLTKAADSALWAAVAKARLQVPLRGATDAELAAYHGGFMEHVDGALEAHFPKQGERQAVVRLLTGHSAASLLRLAHAQARMDGTRNLNRGHYKRSHDLKLQAFDLM